MCMRAWLRTSQRAPEQKPFKVVSQAGLSLQGSVMAVKVHEIDVAQRCGCFLGMQMIPDEVSDKACRQVPVTCSDGASGLQAGHPPGIKLKKPNRVIDRRIWLHGSL